MPENVFQKEVIDRLARMETKLDATAETVKLNTETINQHSIQITENSQSVKSAHHRIDGIFYAAGAVGGVAGFVINAISQFWEKIGGK